MESRVHFLDALRLSEGWEENLNTVSVNIIPDFVINHVILKLSGDS